MNTWAKTKATVEFALIVGLAHALPTGAFHGVAKEVTAPKVTEQKITSVSLDPRPAVTQPFVPKVEEFLRDIKDQRPACAVMKDGKLTFLGFSKAGSNKKIEDTYRLLRRLPSIAKRRDGRESPVPLICTFDDMDKGLAGYFINYYRAIVLDNKENDLFSLAFVLDHEMQHAYQYERLRDVTGALYTAAAAETDATVAGVADAYALFLQGDQRFMKNPYTEKYAAFLDNMAGMYKPALLIAHARETGWITDLMMRRLFSVIAPDEISDHFKQFQKISSSSVKDEAVFTLTGKSYLDNASGVAAYTDRLAQDTMAIPTNDPLKKEKLAAISDRKSPEMAFYTLMHTMATPVGAGSSEAGLNKAVLDRLDDLRKNGNLDYLFNIKDYRMSVKLYRRAALRSGALGAHDRSIRARVFDRLDAELQKHYRRHCPEKPVTPLDDLLEAQAPGCG